MILNRYVSVALEKKNAPGEFSSRQCTYIDGVGLVVGDMVIAPTGNGECVGKVTESLEVLSNMSYIVHVNCTISITCVVWI